MALTPEPKTQTGAPPTMTGTKTVTLVCEECETPKEFSEATVMRWSMSASPEPERTCRVCGLVFRKCPVGGM